MPITIGGYGQFYGNAGGGEVGAMLYKAAQRQVNFARMVELENLNMKKRALREQEATQAARQAENDRNYELAQSKLALEQQRLDYNDALRQDQKAATEERFRQALVQKELERQERQRRYEAEQAYKQQQLDMKRQSQESLDAYRASRLGISQQKQAQKAGNAAPAEKPAKISASNYDSILNNYISGLEASKKDKDGWIEREAKRARSLADEDETMATRASNLERWGFMNENQRYGTGLYGEVQKNTWSERDGKVLEFAKRFRDFAKANPQIYTEYGFQPMFDQVDWEKVSDDERDEIFSLMRPGATKEEVALVYSLLGGLPLTNR